MKRILYLGTIEIVEVLPKSCLVARISVEGVGWDGRIGLGKNVLRFEVHHLKANSGELIPRRLVTLTNSSLYNK